MPQIKPELNRHVLWQERLSWRFAGMVAIENIKAGDKVISTNHETFETAEKTVLETYIREDSKLIHLVIN